MIARIEEGAAPAIEVAEEAPAAAPAKSTEDAPPPVAAEEAPAAQADSIEASTALSPDTY